MSERLASVWARAVEVLRPKFEPVLAPAMVEMVVVEFLESYRKQLDPPSRAVQ
jgi:hypothetical protein